MRTIKRWPLIVMGLLALPSYAAAQTLPTTPPSGYFNAVAANPKGPFVDSRTEPLVCQTDQGGTIDASPFRDADGKLYLYYKSDGNAVGKRTIIWGQRLSDDGQDRVA